MAGMSSEVRGTLPTRRPNGRQARKRMGRASAPSGDPCAGPERGATAGRGSRIRGGRRWPVGGGPAGGLREGRGRRGCRGRGPGPGGRGGGWPRRWRWRARGGGARLRAGASRDAPMPGSRGGGRLWDGRGHRLPRRWRRRARSAGAPPGTLAGAGRRRVGTTSGRLRRLLSGLGSRGARVREVLDPRVRPEPRAM